MLRLFIKDVARQAGAAALQRFGKDGVLYMKSESPSDVVTKADRMADEMICDRIKYAYPEHGIISEEGGKYNEGAEYVWVVDPIDGTLNFSRIVAMWGVMICLVHKGEVILSVMYLPATNDMYFAEAGLGAYRNGIRIQCSQHATLNNSYGCGAAKNSKRPGKFTQKLLDIVGDAEIQYGSFASMAVNACAVASGGRDWMVALTGSIWDFAPAYLMLKEAGCIVTDCKGDPWKFGQLEMVAANPKLHAELLKVTKDI